MTDRCPHPEAPVDAVLVDGTSVCGACNPWLALRHQVHTGEGVFGRCSTCGRIAFPDPCRDCAT